MKYMPDEKYTLPLYARQALADHQHSPQRGTGELNQVMKRLHSEGNTALNAVVEGRLEA